MFNINYIKNYVNIVINFICYYLEIFPIISNYLEKFSWTVFITSKNSKARLGIIRTPHGKIYTPAFIFCATKATMRSASTAPTKKTTATSRANATTTAPTTATTQTTTPTTKAPAASTTATTIPIANKRQ